MIERIEDLFEPLNAPEQPTPKTLDEAVEAYTFEEVYGMLQKVAGDIETRRGTEDGAR